MIIQMKLYIRNHMLVHFASAVKLTLLLFSFYCLSASPSKAQEIASVISSPVVIELFSSQACAFCPKADTLLATLAEHTDVIGIDCHVDYFDVQKGSLAQSFCTARQTAYESYLRAGPNYTPQMVINGAYDVVGYKEDLVKKAIAGIEEPVARIDIENNTDNLFSLSLPSISTKKPLSLIVFLLDKPHDVKIASGVNRSKNILFKNIASGMQVLMNDWDGAAQIVQISVALKDQHQGFAVLVQDPENGKILAAGAYKTLH